MDLAVLRGFGDSLSRVRAIQFEYGLFNLGSRTLLLDFYRLLTPFGFQIGRVRPGRVDFQPYHYRQDRFIGGNYVAVKDHALIDSLAGTD
jgi:hypothetical protein